MAICAGAALVVARFAARLRRAEAETPSPPLRLPVVYSGLALRD